MRDKIEIYRFNEFIAVNPLEGDTFYLKPTEAADLGLALLRHSEDCRRTTFTESEISPDIILTNGKRR